MGLLALSSMLIEHFLKLVLEAEFLIGLFILLYTVLVTYLICRKLIIKPLNDVTMVLRDIAEGEGDLTNRVSMQSRNEIGQLTRWFNKFISNQMNIIKRVKNSLKASKKTVKTVSNSNQKIQDSIKLIESTVHVLSNNAAEQNDLFEKTQQE